jgi:hypothetical protein
MDRLKELLEVGGKALLVIVGACYVIGIIVINIHLSRYGFHSLNLLQLNYVTAGMWALSPILILVFVLAYILHTFFAELDQARSESRKGKLIVISFCVLFGVGGALLWLRRIVVSVGVGLGWKLLGLLGLGIVVGIFFWGSVDSLRAKGSFLTVKSAVSTLQLIFMTALFFIIYLNYFATEFYKDLPPAFGGGRPHDVRFVVEPNAKPFLENAGLQFASEVQTQPLQLIISTDREYVVLTSQSQNAVSVPNGLVKAVIFEKK